MLMLAPLVWNVAESSNFVNYMQQIKYSVINSSGGVFGAAAAIAGVLSMITVVKITIDIMNGKGTPVWDICKPFVIVFLCTNFSWFLWPLDFVANSAAKACGEVAQKHAQTNWETLTKIYSNEAKLEEKDREETQRKVTGVEPSRPEDINNMSLSVTSGMSENASVVGDPEAEISKPGFMDKVGDVVESVLSAFWTRTVTGWLGKSSQIIHILFSIVGVCMEGFAQAYLAMLSLLGVFVLAFTVVPGFGGFREWICRYIQVSFWAPCVCLIDSFYQTAIRFTTDTSFIDAASFKSLAGTLFTMADMHICHNVIGICCIAMIFAVPKMAAIVVQSTGLNGVPGGAAKAGALVAAAIKVATKV